MERLFCSRALSRLTLGCYFLLLFVAVVPFHQHADMGSHDDCAVCAIACQPCALQDGVFMQAIFTFLLTLVLPGAIVCTVVQHTLRLRGPPLV